MSDPSDRSPAGRLQDRKARQAEALRRNLARRKQQARARADHPGAAENGPDRRAGRDEDA